MSDSITYEPLDVEVEKEENEEQVLFIPEEIKKRKQFSTLYLIDLPFTADEPVKKGINIIGYRGIYDQDSISIMTIDTELIKLIEDKKVKNLVLMFPSDILEIDFQHGNKNDLASPLFNVYYAVKKFKERFLIFGININLYFSHIKHAFYSENIKNLNDLYSRDKVSLVESLKKINRKKSAFFEYVNLTDTSIDTLYKHLKLNNVNDFYSYNEDILKYNEFVYQRVSWANNGETVEKQKHNDTSMFMFIAGVLHKRVVGMSAEGHFNPYLEKYPIGHVRMKYGADFLNDITCYDGIINLPDNTSEYKKVINTDLQGDHSTLYNIYHPVHHEPKRGEWPNIEKFLKHIFSTENINDESLYEFGLDYMQLIYTNPITRLPILCLISKEFGTGKSTFLHLLKYMYANNMTIVDNNRFSSKFTGHWAGKLIIGGEEIKITDPVTMELVKDLATNPYTWLEGKGQDAKQVDNFVKMIILSNHTEDFIKIDPGQDRYCVMYVNSIKGKKDPYLKSRMEKEVPAFLNFLLNRKLKYRSKDDRFYFHTDVYTTRHLQIVMENSKSHIETELEEFIQFVFSETEKDQLEFAAVDLMKMLKNYSGKTFDKSRISSVLRNNYSLISKYGRYNTYWIGNNNKLNECSKPGHYFEFNKEYWIKS